ncbi:histidine phosphatase family protein [Actinomadura barringtoniae]|uniref:Histidine phosphatase family protein n=1 Tax=Actinomadura barringtoniae TaxID=1427535 RepID=A0A939P844_9ACTN|nr:histidine phosphatase family protein [Actinomadura barringtoniae]MBO2447596.1 histidine phosphatase family protein [Actinomadura barringtoniae]
MATRLLLIAHAATEATKAARFPDDEPVTETAVATARQAAGGIRRPGTVLCGPERRCLDTCAALDLAATAEPALADLDLGAWRGAEMPQIQSIDPEGFHAWLTDPDAAPHGGESITALLARVEAFLDALPREPSRVVAVTHPAVIRAAVLRVLEAPARALWNLDAAPLSQTHLSWNAGKWRLRETGHVLAFAD